jgi:hypothetical protein
MKGFLSLAPILTRKQEMLDLQDLDGAWKICWQVGDRQFSAVYTRIDQVFVIWGLMAVLMFSVAQVIPLSWGVQAIAWSALTAIGIVCMVGLTTFWARVERLMWLVYCWAALMLGGVVLTDLGIFLGWGTVLVSLCPLWLGLSAIGYFCTGFGLQSRTFVLLGMIHLASAWYVQNLVAWQFLVTGFVIGGSLLFLAQVQWDMRPPIDYALLTVEQQEFNQRQHQLRMTERAR